MCTYNGAQYIEEQLASILTQTRAPDELLICDDGSHDNTLAIIQSFASKIPFETHIHCNKTTLGITKNFEKTISLCSGDVIALSDQDDVWHPQKLYQIEQVFLQNPHIGGVFTNAAVVDQNLQPFGFSLWDVVHFTTKEQILLQRGKALDILLKHLVVTGATLAFRSTWRDKLIPIPHCWMHDAWIALTLAAFSKLAIIQEELIQYRQHGNNQIGGMPKGIGFRMQETFALDREFYYGSELERYQVARDHFGKWFSPEHKTMKKLFAKEQHLQTRSHLPARRCLRIPIILKELFTGRYRRYSVNWQVAVRDLLIA
jgi:glycosyltransferase involved in cell wall biosynthesis